MIKSFFSKFLYGLGVGTLLFTLNVPFVLASYTVTVPITTDNAGNSSGELTCDDKPMLTIDYADFGGNVDSAFNNIVFGYDLFPAQNNNVFFDQNFLVYVDNGQFDTLASAGTYTFRLLCGYSDNSEDSFDVPLTVTNPVPSSMIQMPSVAVLSAGISDSAQFMISTFGDGGLAEMIIGLIVGALVISVLIIYILRATKKVTGSGRGGYLYPQRKWVNGQVSGNGRGQYKSYFR